MSDRVDRLLKGDVGQEQPQGSDRVDRLLSGGGPTISARPTGVGGRPEFDPTRAAPEPAGFGTLTKAGFVRDPQEKIKVFARARGIDPKRYGITKDGEIYYIDEGGYPQKETLDAKATTGAKARRFAAESVAETPTAVLSSVGALAGPLGAGAGALAGESIRTAVEAGITEKVPKLVPTAGRLAIAGTTGAISEKVGGKLIKGFDVLQARKAARLAKIARVPSGKAGIDVAEAKAVEALGKKHGIKLVPPQTTRSPELISTFNLLGDLPETANTIGGIRREQFGQIQQSIFNYLDTLAPPGVTAAKAGQRAVTATQKAIKAATTVRQNKARPFYNRAFASGKTVDVKPVLDLIDGELATAKGPVRQHLIRAKNLLLKPDLPKTKGPGVLVDAAGKPLVKAEKAFDTSLKGLHSSKIALDDIISKAQQTGLGNTVKRNYTAVKQALLAQMDAVSPDYKKARQIFSSESDVLTQLAGKGRITARIAKLEGDEVERVSRMLFAPVSSSPQIVNRAKQVITKFGGRDAWDGLLRNHMQRAYDSIKESVTGGITNIGGRFRQKVFGDPQQKKMMKAAMSKEQFEYLNGFATVLDRVGLILGRESTTASRQIAIQRLKERGKIPVVTEVLKTIAQPLRTPWRAGIEKFNEAVFARSNEAIAESLISRKGASQLKRLLQLSPKSEQFARSLVVFSTAISAGGVRRAGERSTRGELVPPILQERGTIRPQNQRIPRLQAL